MLGVAKSLVFFYVFLGLPVLTLPLATWGGRRTEESLGPRVVGGVCWYLAGLYLIGLAVIGLSTSPNWIMGAAFLALAPLGLVTGLGSIRRRGWSRPLAAVLFLATVVVAAIDFFTEGRLRGGGALGWGDLLVVAICVGCLAYLLKTRASHAC